MSKAAVAEAQRAGDFHLEPSSGGAALDSSNWPLLLKNFHQLNIRSSHFTPLPNGARTQEQRDNAAVKRERHTLSRRREGDSKGDCERLIERKKEKA